MNRIITTDISDPTIQQPFTGNSLDFLQDANKDVASFLAISQIGNQYVSGNSYILQGLIPYGTNQYTEGYILHDGEVFYCPGKSTTTAFVNTQVMVITEANDGTADPITFSDGISRNAHKIRTISLTDAVSGTGDFDLSAAFYWNKWIAAATPLFAGYDLAGALVVGGIAISSIQYIYSYTANGIKLKFSGTNFTTLVNTAEVVIDLPISIPTVGGGTSIAVGYSACRLFKIGTGGVPVYARISLLSSGSGTGLTIAKSDGTAFGVLSGYSIEFVIDIDFVI